MTYPEDPPTIYDQIIENRDYCEHKATTVPIRTTVIDEIAAHVGETEVKLEQPDGTPHTVTGEGDIPEREELKETLLAAQRAFNEKPLTTLTNLFEGRLGPLHYTNSTAHFAVDGSIFDARGQRDTGPMPNEFKLVGVKAAHLLEGFKIAENLPHHWVNDLGWKMIQREMMEGKMGGGEIPDYRSPPVEECFVVNVPIKFPARRFGESTEAPATVVNQAIARTERTLDETLLTKRMAQMHAIKQTYGILQSEVDRELIDVSEVKDVDTVIQETFDISESGVASLKSQLKNRQQEAFETVRLLSTSDDFNYVMEEFAETIDDLGELAILGTKYREEVLGKSPGFY